MLRRVRFQYLLYELNRSYPFGNLSAKSAVEKVAIWPILLIVREDKTWIFYCFVGDRTLECPATKAPIGIKPIDI